MSRVDEIVPRIDSADGAMVFVTGLLLNQGQHSARAWAGALALRERLVGNLEPAAILALSPDALRDIMRASPAVHRFPGRMSEQLLSLCQHLDDEYDGDPSRIWAPPVHERELIRRLRRLPGVGPHKAAIAVFLLTNVYSVIVLGDQPEGPDLSEICPGLVREYAPVRRSRYTLEWS
jgi:uncharacterized HhH-GPD family protein